MANLFYSLLTTPKIKRWSIMLDRLEEQPLTGNELAKILGCTRRTVISDIKQIKELFDSTLLLLGDEYGYLMELRNPVKYYQKKQTLIESEPLFQMVDTLFDDKNQSNQEWAMQLDLSSATFTRLKQQLGVILQEDYGIQFATKTNQLIGQETRIRQFFFDYYFTLPLYPKALTVKIQQMRSHHSPVSATKWELKQNQLQGWLVITKIRMKQGYTLTQGENDLEVCEKIARALDPEYRLDLPTQEKAALFLATLDEAQFLRPVVQSEFIYSFSSASWGMLLGIEEEGQHVLLFQTLIRLMKNYFHLPYELEANQENLEESTKEDPEDNLLKQLINVFLKEKEQVEQSIYVTFRLIGSQALQRWIKEEIRFQIGELGYYIYDEKAYNGSALPQIHVTNSPNGIRQGDIRLSVVPTREEISEQIQKYQSR
jgi:hypothetical protein